MKRHEPVYLDYSATTPVDNAVLEVMLPYLRGEFGNPGSVHRWGRRSREAIDKARDQVAGLLGVDAREIVFTSGGTESDNLALLGVLGADHRSPRRLIVSAVEHHAVLRAAETLARRGEVELRVIPVDAGGLVDPAEVKSALDSHTVLVSIMHANNETGAIQPVEEIGALCRERGVLFHTDAVQSAGVIPLNLARMPIDLLSLSAHKIYGPKGAGALFVRHEIPLAASHLGGIQERKRRAGTENVAGIVGLGAACARVSRGMISEARRLDRLKARLENAVRARVPDSWVNGPRSGRLPPITNLGFGGVEGELIVLGLDARGVAVSTGSACTSGSLDPSHVLLAMGQDHTRAHSAVRFSLGRFTADDDLDFVAEVVAETVDQLRATAGGCWG